MSKILVTAKIGPDLDGVACAYVYAAFLNDIDKENEYVAGVYGEPHIEARYVLEQFATTGDVVYNPNIKFDKFILVDASELKGMPEIIRSEDVIEIIDHRELHNAEELFPFAKVQVEKVGAAATLIFERIKAHNYLMNRDSAYLLFCAIYSNTLNFESDLTSERDRLAVETLKNSYNIEESADLIAQMFQYKSKYIEDHIEETIVSDFKNFNNGIGVAQLEGFKLEEVIEEKIGEIKAALIMLKEKYQLDYIFLTAADIQKNHNIFVVLDEKSESLLVKSLGLVFDVNRIAKNNKLLLRKQILPLLINNKKL